MAKEIWEIWFENGQRREIDFQKYIKFKKIKSDFSTSV